MNDIIASIIVPVYKVEKTLVKCIESLLNQTVDNYEVILVDDGSPDRCGEICDSYASEKVKVIHQKNTGLPGARNAGMSIAAGEYYLFCDSDDTVEKNFVETFCNYLDKNVSDIVCSCFNSIDVKTSEITEKTINSDKPVLLKKDDFLELRKFDLMAGVWDKAYRASVIKENNLKYADSPLYAEDIMFTLDFIQNSEKDILVIPDRLYNYSYQLGDNLAVKYTSDSFSDKYQVLFRNYQNAFNAFNIKKNKNLTDFYTDFFLTFINCLFNTWDKRNEFGFFKKLIYNHKIVTSKEYKICYDNMDKSRFVKIYLTVCRLRCALLIMAFIKLTKK